MAKVIYLTKDSNAERVVALMERTKGSRLVLVVPSGTLAFSDNKSAKHIQKAAKRLDQEIVIATQDENIHFLAHSLAFKLVGEKYLKRFLAPLVKRRRKRASLVVSSVLVVVIVFVILAMIFLPEATVAVQLRTEPVTRDLEIRVDSSLSEPNIAEPAVPGELVQREVEDRATFDASGSRNVGKVASGFVQIYNFSTTTFILRQETTSISVDGKDYVFAQEVSRIRPTARIGLEGEQIDPSSLVSPVPVVAVSPGAGFNLPAGTRVEIFNDVLGARPEELYGEVVEGISGGTDEVRRVVTEGDVTTAFEQLSQQLIERARTELLSENHSLQLLDSAVNSEVVEREAFNQPGDEVEQFEVRAKAVIKALVFDEAEVRQLVRERIVRLQPNNKVLREAGKNKLESKFLLTDLEQGQGVLATHFEGEISYQINQDEIVSLLPNKSSLEIQELLLSRPEFESVEVEFSPFWVKKAPRFKSKINLNSLP